MWWSLPEGAEVHNTWREKTTVLHEGVPGHHLQIGQTAYRSEQLNRFQRLLCFVSGHGEGWALYAERLRAELGHLDDPGEFLRAHTHMDDALRRDEIDRYLGWPGQAPSYKVGERVWLQCRAEARRRHGAALAATAAGVGLVLPYYGAEAFALHELGERIVAGTGTTAGDLDLLGLAEAIRTGPVQATMFGAGLLLLALGGVLTAVAVWRSGVLIRWAGVPFALAFVLFLPQFYAPAALRIAHGVLVGGACLMLAAQLRRAGETAP